VASKRAASEAGRLLAQLGAKKGGQASAAALSPEQRSERARAAVATRWKSKKTMPVDQAAVLARLRGGDVVALRIAPGAGGRRRWAAIQALALKGLIKVVDFDSESAHVKAE
jgi:hypothetical protein